jgi:hypothetical protein
VRTTFALPKDNLDWIAEIAERDQIPMNGALREAIESQRFLRKKVEEEGYRIFFQREGEDAERMVLPFEQRITMPDRGQQVINRRPPQGDVGSSPAARPRLSK